MAFSTAMNEPYLYNNVNSDSYRTSSYQSQNNSVGYGNSYPSANPSVFNIINPTNSTTPKLQQSFSSPDDMSINKIVTFSDNNSTYSHTYHTHTATSPYPIIKSPYSNTMSGHSQSATTTNISSFSNNISEPSLKSRQSSKSFGGGNYNHSDKIETPTHTINWNELVPMCPNMVMQKCRCKHILKQNKEAKKLWHSCYRINVSNVNYQIDNREIEIAYFDGLYSKLNEYFQYKVQSQRIPSKYQISEAIKRFGAFVISENNDIVIDRCHFITFWKWYRGICDIIKDCYNLWDTQFPFELNLFLDRSTCQSILERAPAGTFILRLSQSQYNGVVISYSEPSFNRKICVKHLLLIRHEKDNYVTKTNHNSHKATSLNSLVRNFIKLKFVYTPHLIYEKKHVF